MDKNSNKWDINQILTFIGVIIALIGLVVAVIAVVVTITTPELRVYLSLDSVVPTGKEPKPPVVPTGKPEPPVYKTTTLYENQPKFVKEASTTLSVAFHNIKGEKTASVTIVPDGKQSSNHAVLNGYDEKFTSSAGDFILHVLSIDWNSRTITVKISKKVPTL